MPIDNYLLKLFGLIDLDFINLEDSQHSLHKEIYQSFKKLSDKALLDGHELMIASSYRPFSRQLRIWNEKVQGTRAILDKNEKPLDADDFSSLSDLEKIHSILYFSALPGLSRHHLGTDLDVFDSKALPLNYKLQLTQKEYKESGPLFQFSKWLQGNLTNFGFYYPYSQNGAVAQEPWHISHQATSSQLKLNLNKNKLLEFYQSFSADDFALIKCVVENFDALFETYFENY